MLLSLWRKLLPSQYQKSRRGRRTPARNRLGYRPRLEQLEERLTPTTHTWSGLGGGWGSWSDPANWQAGSTPAGDSSPDLVFPATKQPISFNNLGSIKVHSITFDAAGYGIYGNPLTLTEGIADDVSGANTIYCDVALASTLTHPMSAAAGGTLTMAGVISGPGGGSILTTGGQGTVVFSGHNTYSASTQIQGGTLRLDSSLAIGQTSAVTVAIGANLVLNDDATTKIGSLAGAGTVNLGVGWLATGWDNSSTTFSGTISGNAPTFGVSLTKAGSGTFTLSLAAAYPGQTHIDGGILKLGAANALPSASAVSVGGGALLDLHNFSDTIGSLAGAGNVQMGSGSLYMGGNNSSTSFSGIIDGAGGSLYKKGNGTFTFSGMGLYTGGTHIDDFGTVKDGANGPLPSQGTVTVAQFATLDLNNYFDTIGSLAGAGAVKLGGGTLSTADNTSTTFSGVISGGGSLDKGGSGTLTLTGANTYTGSTYVSSGTLLVNGSLSSQSPVSVNNSFTILGGTGTVGDVTVGFGSQLAPGPNGGTGTLHTGKVTFNAGSSYAVQLNGTAPGTYDQLGAGGQVDLSGATLKVALGPNFAQAQGQTLTIMQFSSRVGTFQGLPEGAGLMIGNHHFTIHYKMNSVELYCDF